MDRYFRKELLRLRRSIDDIILDIKDEEESAKKKHISLTESISNNEYVIISGSNNSNISLESYYEGLDIDRINDDKYFTDDYSLTIELNTNDMSKIMEIYFIDNMIIAKKKAADVIVKIDKRLKMVEADEEETYYERGLNVPQEKDKLYGIRLPVFESQINNGSITIIDEMYSKKGKHNDWNMFAFNGDEYGIAVSKKVLQTLSSKFKIYFEKSNMQLA